MAEVHLARTIGPLGIDKLLVIKRLLPEFAANGQFVRQFLNEARLSVALDHPNIVQVYDVDEVDGTVFYAMELLHGRDVRHLVRSAPAKPIPLEQALAIVIAACAGLHYAHEKKGPNGEAMGIVHRDISPHNLFVRFDGSVKVIDFGIAKALHNHDRTATGDFLKGKYGYMSPEQCLGQPLDRRTDVFSMSIVLWELTTGRRLYPGPHEYAMLKKVVEKDAEAPRQLVPGYPERLEQIVLRGLQRDRIGRYPTVEMLQLELESFVQSAGLDVSARALSRYMDLVFPGESAKQPAARVKTVLGSRAEPGAELLLIPKSVAKSSPPDRTSHATLTETAAGDQLVDDSATALSRRSAATPPSTTHQRPWPKVVATALGGVTIVGLSVAFAVSQNEIALPSPARSGLQTIRPDSVLLAQPRIEQEPTSTAAATPPTASTPTQRVNKGPPRKFPGRPTAQPIRVDPDAPLPRARGSAPTR